MNTEYICDGSCCERFFLPHPPEKMWKFYEDSLMNDEELIPDIFKIGPMIIPIEPVKDSETGWWYTCKHWNKESKLCNIYSKRPKMCVDYPYGKPCTYCDSTCGTIESKKEVLPAGPVNIDELFAKRRKDG